MALGGALPAPAYAYPPSVAQPASPLLVELDALSPPALRRGEPVAISGSVTNRTGQTWLNLKAYMVVSTSPITSRGQLAEAAASDPAIDIGRRIVTLGRFAELGNLEAGATKRFSLEVPYRELGISGTPGVYWVGAQVLATDPLGGRDLVADGQVRTFSPLVPDASRPVRLSLLWPLTAPVPELRPRVFADDDLGAAMAPGGRLEALLAMAVDAPPEVTLVVDPAVLAAAEQMSDGYQVEASAPREGLYSTDARDWLGTLVGRGQAGASVLALPYGDPDVSSLAHAGVRAVVPPAVAAAHGILERLGVDASVGSWPLHGLGDRPVLAAGNRAGVILSVLTDRVLPPSPTGNPDAALAIRAGGQSVPVVVADSAMTAGGPHPGPTDSPLQMRQRILAESALVSLSSLRTEQPATMVAALPRQWDPGERWQQARFFPGLSVPWLSFRPVTDVLPRNPPDFVGRLRYPAAVGRAELSEGLLDGVRRLRRASATLTGLLADSSQERPGLDRALGIAASVAWRSDPATGRTVTDARLTAARSSLRRIGLQVSQFVTLSSRSGRFPVTILNDLDQPVRVGLSVLPANAALAVDPVRPVEIPANQRATITVTAHADAVGLTDVAIRPATADGRVFGQGQVVNVRATQYGVVGWVIIGAGAVVLAASSALRILRRLFRRQQRTTSPAAR